MDPILNNLSAYGGKYAPGLIGQVFRNLLEQGLTILQNVKGPTKYARLKVGRGLKAYTGIFQPSDLLNYSDRELSPKMAQYDLLIDPRKYRDSYMTEVIDKNSKWYGIPEENYVWAQVLAELADEIVQYCIWKGDTTSNDPASKIVDGLRKAILQIIAAGRPAITLGVITNNNAVGKFETLYETAMDGNSQFRKMAMNLYCSYSNQDKYIENYRDAFPQDPAIYSDGEKPLKLKKSNGKVTITAVDWLQDSDALILTPQTNLLMGTDKLSDLNTINTVKDVYTLKAGISFTMGFQVRDEEGIWYSDGVLAS